MTEKKESFIRKNNMKLYPFYQMIGGDWMFYYAISLLFLVETKKFSVSSAVLLDSFFSFFSIFFSIPIALLIQKIGKKKSIVLGNIFNIFFFLIWIFCSDYNWFILSELFGSIGSCLKNTSENAFLHESIPVSNNKTNIFTKINSKGFSKLSYFTAFTLMLSGILFDINPYIPIICSLICIIFASIVSYSFIDIKELENNKTETKKAESIFSDFRAGLHFIIKSKRIKALFLMLSAIWGILCLIILYRTTLLESIGCSASFIGIFVAFLEILKGIGSTKSNFFNSRFKNKSLTIIMLSITILLIIIGTVTLTSITFFVQLSIIIFSFSIIATLNGIYLILRNRYLNSFTNSTILTKVYSVYGITSNLFRMLITLIGSAILARTDIRFAVIFVGLIFTIFGILVSLYMRTRVGLSPEKYGKDDIKI